MNWIADANIYLRTINPQGALYADTLRAVTALEQRGDQILLVPQNLFEVWNALTRPIANNGFGFAILDALTVISDMESKHPLWLDTLETLRQWKRLIEVYEVKGVQVHDARMAAACLSHNVTHILTYNTTDFQRYAAELTAVAPPNV